MSGFNLNPLNMINTLLRLVPSALVIFCIWKFYQMLCKINDNLAGIRQAVVRYSGGPPPE